MAERKMKKLQLPYGYGLAKSGHDTLVPDDSTTPFYGGANREFNSSKRFAYNSEGLSNSAVSKQQNDIPVGIAKDINDKINILRNPCILPLTTKNKPALFADRNKEHDLKNNINDCRFTSTLAKLDKKLGWSINSPRLHSISPTRPLKIKYASNIYKSTFKNQHANSRMHDKLNSISSNANIQGSANTANCKARQNSNIVVLERLNNLKSSTVMKGNDLNLTNSINSDQQPQLNLNVLTYKFPFYENSKFSSKSCNLISAYAANTHHGTVRTYNEDRVSIILNIMKPPTYRGGYWPKCSYFAVYDGHGGFSCADFLRDHLHQFIIKDSKFPYSPKDAIIQGCALAEETFIKKYALSNPTAEIEKSGSCAVFALIVDDICYVGNVGDSRAVLSKFQGKDIKSVTNDHKPNDENESKRIYQNGGSTYQTRIPVSNIKFPSICTTSQYESNQIMIGPCRVFPGRLSVSRSFGDVEAKLEQFGGLPDVLIATPEISSFKITNETDFLFLGCDGIFDLLKNEDIVNGIFMIIPDYENGGFHSLSGESGPIHKHCGTAVDMIMKTALSRNCLDNITSVLIAFSGLEAKIKQPKTLSSYANKESFESTSHSDLNTAFASKTTKYTSGFSSFDSSKLGFSQTTSAINKKLMTDKLHLHIPQTSYELGSNFHKKAGSSTTIRQLKASQSLAASASMPLVRNCKDKS